MSKYTDEISVRETGSNHHDERYGYHICFPENTITSQNNNRWNKPGESETKGHEYFILADYTGVKNRQGDISN